MTFHLVKKRDEFPKPWCVEFKIGKKVVASTDLCGSKREAQRVALRMASEKNFLIEGLPREGVRV